MTLTTLGRRGSFLLLEVLASLTGPGAGSLAGRDGFLWSFWSAEDGLGAGLRGAEACGGAGRAVTAALAFNREAG
ncbi:hypothetical protein [Candidatus Synechococcus spongiarum]|uniref:hypothetical protein n=1 Tax=Candidatus Synechococcus spongiarum TaxID=431041 RepID=UPI001268546F|nr:hypothetical protein [Candidatus Synechococcus spongiarum]